MRNLRTKLGDLCDIYALVENNVPGNTPTTGVEKHPSQTEVPCSKEKEKTVIVSTSVGEVPVINYVFLLPPDVDVKENYRLKHNGSEYTVLDANPRKRFRRRVNHIEVIARKRS